MAGVRGLNFFCLGTVPGADAANGADDTSYRRSVPTSQARFWCPLAAKKPTSGEPDGHSCAAPYRSPVLPKNLVWRAGLVRRHRDSSHVVFHPTHLDIALVRGRWDWFVEEVFAVLNLDAAALRCSRLGIRAAHGADVAH